MRKTILATVMVIAFCSLFFTPADDNITWGFIIEKIIEVAVFVLAGRAYDKAESRT